MTAKAIEYRARKLQELEAQKKVLEEQIDKVKAEIQEEMGQQEEMEAGKYLIKWIFINTSRFDTKTFKESYPELYRAYSKANSSRRFSVVSK